MSRTFLSVLSPLALVLASCGSPISAQKDAAHDSAAHEVPAGSEPFTVTDVATFDEPWAMAFLPGAASALVTERAGKLKLWQASGPVLDVAGVPPVDYGGQGGLGDVALAPDFATTGTIYLSWAEAGTNDTRGAAVARAKLVTDGGKPRLEGLQVIWRQVPKVTGRGHYSHRIAISPDGQYLFLSSGERQKFDPAQDLGVNLGKIIRLLPDGSPAPGNPFADRGGVSAQIWSYGHRNVLGLKFDEQGRLWDLEHGPAGGDELNIVKPGQNYGWPIVSNGDHYDGRPIPRHATRPEFAAPAVSWNPVIAPGDFLFYSGKAFPAWKDQALIAGLGSEALVRVAIDGESAREVERYPLGNRLREIKEAPDGTIWLLEDGKDAKLRKLSPKP